MSFVELLVIAVGLAMDAFAVTISDSLAYPTESPARLFRLPVMFGLFQGLMPIGGYVLSGVAANLVEAYAGIVALVVLAIIGGNMVRDGLLERASAEADCVADTPRLSWGVIVLQAIATAIDAFAIGISLRALDADLLASVTVIGLVTFLFCCVSVALGQRIGGRLGWKAEVAGGLILIAIGIRAFFS